MGADVFSSLHPNVIFHIRKPLEEFALGTPDVKKTLAPNPWQGFPKTEGLEPWRKPTV
jgi:hypothetical protein